MSIMIGNRFLWSLLRQVNKEKLWVIIGRVTSYQNSLTKTQVPDWPANLSVQSSQVPEPKILPATHSFAEYLGTQRLVKQMWIFWRGPISTCFPCSFPSQMFFQKFYPRFYSARAIKSPSQIFFQNFYCRFYSTRAIKHQQSSKLNLWWTVCFTH